MTNTPIPLAAYGILQQNRIESSLDEVAEQVKNLGYAILESGYSASELQHLSNEFDRTRKNYVEMHGETKLKSLNEYHTIRAPLTFGSKVFQQLAFNTNLLSLLKKLIPGKFILNQQNGVINPPQENYNQGSWHRDLPYQHFVSSQPLAINALFCVDDFTIDNGATFVLPASHKSEAFPSERYIQKNAIQLQAKAGSFIVLDCMMFHTGGFNATNSERRAVNHVYNIPYFKQQINLAMNLDDAELSSEEKEILGFHYMEPRSIEDYLSKKIAEKY